MWRRRVGDELTLKTGLVTSASGVTAENRAAVRSRLVMFVQGHAAVRTVDSKPRHRLAWVHDDSTCIGVMEEAIKKKGIYECTAPVSGLVKQHGVTEWLVAHIHTIHAETFRASLQSAAAASVPLPIQWPETHICVKTATLRNPTAEVVVDVVPEIQVAVLKRSGEVAHVWCKRRLIAKRLTRALRHAAWCPCVGIGHVEA